MVAIMMIAGASAANAQKGEQALGVNVVYGTEISNVGFGVQYQLGITDALRLAPSFEYYLKKNGVTFWDINANLHYVFNLSDKFEVYPLAGVGYAHTKTEYDEDGSVSAGDFAINVGGGAGYHLSDNLSLMVDLKYQIISGFSQFAPAIGLKFRF